jgi:hypothetical protein
MSNMPIIPVSNLAVGQYLEMAEGKKKSCLTRVIYKVRKTQHQNPEFGHTEGEIFFFKPAKKYTSIQGGMKLRKLSILVVN